MAKPWEIPIRYVDTRFEKPRDVVLNPDLEESSDAKGRRAARDLEIAEKSMAAEDNDPLAPSYDRRVVEDASPVDYSRGKHSKVIDCTERLREKGADTGPVDYANKAPELEAVEDDLEDADDDEAEFAEHEG